MSRREVLIVGGGPAGLTLGIALRRRGVPVQLWEAGTYPRHRVCGEFISGPGLEVLSDLELLGLLEGVGGRRAQTVAFFEAGGLSLRHGLPQPALCVSRFTLEQTLAAAFRRLGGRLHEGERWRGDFCTQGVVRATGRRVARPCGRCGWRWFGMKLHAHNVELAADLEMHVADDGYIGLCRVETGAVNVCGLFRRRPADTAPGGRDQLRGEAGTLLGERLAQAHLLESSYCAVGGLDWSRPNWNWVSPAPKSVAFAECCVGDALASIPPLTGNGMSMAFESAALAAEPLANWSAGELSWEEACGMIRSACYGAFARRLAWGRWIQRAMFVWPLRVGLAAALRGSTALWRMLFWRTRCGGH